MHGPAAVRRPVAALCAALALAGCSAGPAPEAADPSADRPVPVPAAPTALPAAPDLESSCADALDDGGGHELAGAWLVSSGDVLVVAFSFTAPPVSGDTSLSVELRTADGSPATQLGVELDGADPVAAFVATSPTDPVQRLDGTVHVLGTEVHAAFPAAVLDDLGPGWGWVAYVSSGTTTEDSCPGTGAGGAVAPVVP